MPTSKSFTESRSLEPSVAGLFVLVILAGCAATDPVQNVELVESPDRIEQVAAPVVEPPPVSRNNETNFARALAAIQEGALDEAEELLLSITEAQPELAGPWINLGQVLVSRGRTEDAKLAFQNAIRANPASCVAYNQLGVLSRQDGDFAAAEAMYQACLSRVPGFKDAYLNLGILYELYLGKLPEALAAYRQYQTLTGESDRKVKGWVIDLERRLGV